MVRVVLSVTLVVVLSAGRVQADTVYDNGIGTEDVDWMHISYFSTVTGTQWQAGDDFRLDAGQWRVDGATWTGGLYEFGDFQNTIGETFEFALLILADNGGMPTGAPGDPIPGTAIAHRTVTATGTNANNPNGGIVARFEAAFDPIILDGETDYWLIVAATGEFDYHETQNPDGSLWMFGGQLNTGNSHQGNNIGGNAWTFRGNTQYFQLSGNRVPEPGSALVMLVGFIGVAIGFRRRY